MHFAAIKHGTGARLLQLENNFLSKAAFCKAMRPSQCSIYVTIRCEHITNPFNEVSFQRLIRSVYLMASDYTI